MRTGLRVRLAAVLLGLGLPFFALAQQSVQPPTPQQQPWNWPGPWHMWHGGSEFWWIVPMLMLLMVVACVVFFLFGHRLSGHLHGGPWQMMHRPQDPGHSWGDPTYSAQEVLSLRFAKGEIRKQEFEEKRMAIVSRVQS